MEGTCVKPTLKPYACPIVCDYLHLYVISWLSCLWYFSLLMQLLYIVIFFFKNVFIRTLMCCIYGFWFLKMRLQGVSKHIFYSFQSLFLNVFTRTLMLLFFILQLHKCNMIINWLNLDLHVIVSLFFFLLCNIQCFFFFFLNFI
jgi:hypothetical protein